LIKHLPQISDEAKAGVLQHHERLDGSGYPYGLTDGDINQYAKIIAIADIYDAMTSERPYRRRLTPLAAMEAIADQMYEKLETGICLTFLDNLQDFFTGNSVLLSNGQRAKIIVLSGQDRFWTKPLVCGANGTLLDLQHEEISIVDLIAEG
jgi:HD-GYP domain-containing protein (c-di-GMP phosphodiesterase class II)